MRAYIEEKMKDARPAFIEIPPVQQESEEVIDGPSIVRVMMQRKSRIKLFGFF